MRLFLSACLAASLLFLCGFMQYDRGVLNGYYYSETRPNIRLKIDPSLRYLGTNTELEQGVKYQIFVWLTPGEGPGLDKLFIVEHATVSADQARFTTSKLFRGIPAFTKGKMDIGGESYQYVLYLTQPGGTTPWSEYITGKGFILNKPMITGVFGKISTDTAWTKFYYMKPYDPEKHFRGGISPQDDALLKQFIADFKNDVQYRGKYK